MGHLVTGLTIPALGTATSKEYACQQVCLSCKKVVYGNRQWAEVACGLHQNTNYQFYFHIK